MSVAAGDTAAKSTEQVERITILFCGDSGDGMQLTGSQFTTTSAVIGNGVSTFPDYPSEIRAPAGSVAGVSAFQLNFSSQPILTAGDRPDVLVAMNPAALKVHLPRLDAGGQVIVNRDAFNSANLKKAGYDSSPLDDGDLQARYHLHTVPITTLTFEAATRVDLDRRSIERAKNFFALGLLYWLYDRSLEPTRDWIERKFASRSPQIAEVNRLALDAGYNYGETAELFPVRYSVPAANPEPGTYRLINGNQASALGFVTAARLAGKPLVYSSYPITPATDVLHELVKLKHLDVRPLQLEDEIAAMGSAIGAAFGGTFSLTGTSGPGLCLKSEAINLAIMLELPLVILNVQRGGPSTGLPTKTEQADLLQAIFGRNGESPLPVLAAASPADSFDIAIEAFRIAVRHTTPVMILTDGNIANSTEAWRVPNFADLEPIAVEHRTDPNGFQPYSRDEATLARPWAIPGTPGLEHRVGGLEKQHLTGNVSYDPDNHQFMSRLRAEKVERTADFLPPLKVEGAQKGDLLVVSWGGTWGAVASACRRVAGEGGSIGHVHLRYLNPFPKEMGDVMSRYRKVLVPELNFGQLALLLRGRYVVDAISLNKLKGQPFTIDEVEAGIREHLR
jgi:2-oxoglutarate ferredoxin oxidoreductase subunit alpha